MDARVGQLLSLNIISVFITVGRLKCVFGGWVGQLCCAAAAVVYFVAVSHVLPWCSCVILFASCVTFAVCATLFVFVSTSVRPVHFCAIDATLGYAITVALSLGGATKISARAPSTDGSSSRCHLRMAQAVCQPCLLHVCQVIFKWLCISRLPARRGSSAAAVGARRAAVATPCEIGTNSRRERPSRVGPAITPQGRPDQGALTPSHVVADRTKQMGHGSVARPPSDRRRPRLTAMYCVSLASPRQ